MTSPAAVVGLRYDGIDLQDDLQIFLEILRGLNEPPTVRGIDNTIPDRAGRSEMNRVNDIIAIELVGLISSDDTLPTDAERLASYRANATFVRALFATNRERAALEADLEDGSTISISARPMNAVWQEHREHATVSIELEGYDDWDLGGS